MASFSLRLILVIAFLSVVVFGVVGTDAFFLDVERGVGNEFGAGVLDVSLGNVTPPDLGTLEPGDTASFSVPVDNVGTLPVLSFDIEALVSGDLEGDVHTEVVSSVGYLPPGGSGIVEVHVTLQNSDCEGESGKLEIDVTASNKGFSDEEGCSANLATSQSSPNVSITSPSEGAEVSGSVSIEADASDNFGVEHVRFFVDGSSIGTDDSSPYEATWDSTNAVTGTHTIEAVAEDGIGQTDTDAIDIVVTEN